MRVLRRQRLPAAVLALVLGLLAVLLGSATSNADPTFADPTSADPTSADPTLPSPSSWPLAGVPAVVRGFDPPTSAWGAGHRGVDLAGSVDTPVLAAAAGTVSYAEMLAGRGVVIVDHGAVRTTYEPVQADVAVGDQVAVGQQIGTLQPGHCADGAVCLHWGLRAGDTYLDPLLLVPGGPAGGGQPPGEYRLLAADDREAVQQRIGAEQQTAAIGVPSSGGGGPSGPAGSHGFSFPVSAAITSPYGMRFHPILHVTKLHDGTDFGAACGSPIRAPYAGKVSAAYFNPGYGNRLMVDHGVVDGRRVVSGFNHAASYVVGVGDRVSKGQLLGYVGTTGYSTGCHLHLMVWLDGKMVDPMSWY
jgi:murein DD-endopeptidase MepM/ murein hydrolase activator NlpD